MLTGPTILIQAGSGVAAPRHKTALLPAHLAFRLIGIHVDRRILLDELLQHFRIDKPGIHIARFIVDMRITVTTGGVKA